MSEISPVTLDDGAQTLLEQWGAAGPIIVCVHGMTSSRRSWQAFAQQFAVRFRVYAYDQRGHGDSADVKGPMSLERGLRDLGNVISAIAQPVDVLVGHSWGGALVIAGGRQLDVRCVIAVDPMIRQVSSEWYDEYIEELDERFALVGAARDAKVREEYAQWPSLDREGKVHAEHSMTSEPIRRLRDENAPEQWNLRHALTAYPKPLLLAMAEDEQSISPVEDLNYVRSRGGPNVTIRVFEGQGHNLYRTDFAHFVRVVDEFLSANALS